jgi:soluble lytic murein transglycosylase
MFRKAILLFFLMIPLCHVTVQADSQELSPFALPESVHTLFAQTKLAIRTKDRQQYWRLQKRWEKNYPNHLLLPYLQRFYYQTFMDDLPSSVIEAFLTRHAQTDFIRSLQFHYLAYLSTRDRARFNRWVKQTPWHWLNSRLQCQYLKNIVQTVAAAKEHDNVLAQLWSTPQSQDKRCDSAFTYWRKAGLLTPDRVMSRIKLVAEKGNPRLIVYLTSLLPDEQQSIGRLWGQVANSPSYIRRLERWGHLSSETLSPIVYFGLRKLIWQDMGLTQSLYADLPDNVRFTHSQDFSLIKMIAIRQTLNHEVDSMYWLSKANRLGQADDLSYWTITSLIREQDWQGVKTYLYKRKDLTTREQYWLARAHAHSGSDDLARRAFLELAEQRHYYGFMAAKQLNQSISLNAKELVLDSRQLNRLSQSKPLQTALALYQVGERWWALQAWNQAMRRLTEEEGLAAGLVAYDLGWHDRAIMAMAEFGEKNLLDVRFPQAFVAEFRAASAEHKQSLSWLYAIARRESAFDPEVRSRTNAYGLMQILPETANYLTRTPVSKNRLKKPDINTDIGARYLAYLEQKISAHPVLVTAAYNAGWKRVLQWLPQVEMDLDIWIETIPFKETREYVQAIITYEKIYAAQIEQDSVFDYVLTYAKISIDDLTPIAQRARLSKL